MLAIIEHLEALAYGTVQPKDTTEGICVEIKTMFSPDYLDDIFEHIKTWTGHSGNELFPVPCPFGGDPELRFRNTTNLWHKEYGDLRKELCMHVAISKRRSID